MNAETRKGQAQTVLGWVKGDDLGFTLPHEHLFADLSNYLVEPSDPSERPFAFQPVTLENLHWVQYHHSSNRDNLLLDDEETAIREARLFKQAGGKTIADVTPNNLGRKPQALAQVAREVGINVIMGTAYYIEQSYEPKMRQQAITEEEIEAEFVRDITVGVGEARIRAGVIGELGCSWPLGDGERVVLRAGAAAQQKTGAPISIHPGHDERGPFEILDELVGAGADPSRVIMGHISTTLRPAARETRLRLAEHGCYIQYDGMGTPEAEALTYRSGLGGLPYMDFANDFMRVDQIIDLIDAGYIDRVLVSMDVWLKTCLASYGGRGYAHIQEMVIPLMLKKGLTEEQVNTITVDNPKHALTFA
jgi:phosphotriesterase-related protein